MLRANMRRAGALRIDHVLGFSLVFLVPAGGRPGTAPMCATRWRRSPRPRGGETDNRCLIVGEDLGTVPEVRRELERRGSSPTAS